MMVTPAERLLLEHRSKWTTTLGFIACVAMQIFIAQSNVILLMALGWFAWLGCLVAFVWGCSDLARSKGYAWQVGLLGLTGIIGYLIIYYMHDRWLAEKRRPMTTTVEDSGYVRDPTRL